MYACSAAMALTLLVVSEDGNDAWSHRDSQEAARTPLVRFVGSHESGSSHAVGATPARYSRASYSTVLGDSASYPEPHVPASVLRDDEHTSQFTPASHTTMSSHVMSEMPHQVCDNCGPCGLHGRCWGVGGKLAAWRAKHDFTPHIPYRALPAESYYFRPYNYTDIPEDQAEVAVYGQDPRMPYANRVFDGIYEGLDEEEIPPIDGMPMDEEPMDDDAATNGQSPFVPVPPPDATPQPSSESDPQSSLQPRRLHPQGGQRSVIFGAPPIPGSEQFVPVERLESLPLSPALSTEGVVRQTSGARARLSDQGSSLQPQNSLR